MAASAGGGRTARNPTLKVLRPDPARRAARRSNRRAVHQGEPPRARAVPAGNASNRSKPDGTLPQRSANTRRKALMDARSAPMSSAELARAVETSQKKPQRLN